VTSTVWRAGSKARTRVLLRLLSSCADCEERGLEVLGCGSGRPQPESIAEAEDGPVMEQPTQNHSYNSAPHSFIQDCPPPPPDHSIHGLSSCRKLTLFSLSTFSVYFYRSKVWDHLEMSLFFKEKHCFFDKDNIKLIRNTLSTLLMW